MKKTVCAFKVAMCVLSLVAAASLEASKVDEDGTSLSPPHSPVVENDETLPSLPQSPVVEKDDGAAQGKDGSGLIQSLFGDRLIGALYTPGVAKYSGEIEDFKATKAKAIADAAVAEARAAEAKAIAEAAEAEAAKAKAAAAESAEAKAAAKAVAEAEDAAEAAEAADKYAADSVAKVKAAHENYARSAAQNAHQLVAEAAKAKEVAETKAEEAERAKIKAAETDVAKIADKLVKKAIETKATADEAETEAVKAKAAVSAIIETELKLDPIARIAKGEVIETEALDPADEAKLSELERLLEAGGFVGDPNCVEALLSFASSDVAIRVINLLRHAPHHFDWFVPTAYDLPLIYGLLDLINRRTQSAELFEVLVEIAGGTNRLLDGLELFCRNYYKGSKAVKGTIDDILDRKTGGALDRKIIGILRMLLGQTYLDKIAELLMNGKADVDKIIACRSGWTLLHRAVFDRELWIVCYLINRGANVNAASSGDNETLLHLAVRRGFVEGVRLLLRCKDIDLTVKGNKGTPLELAHSLKKDGNTAKIIQLLEAKERELKTGQRVDDPDAVDLCNAAEEGHLDDVQRLITEGTSVHAARANGNTALHLAALRGHREIVEFLVENGARINAVSDYGTPLCEAVANERKEVVKFFLSQLGIDVNAGTETETPLVVAVLKGNVRIIELLLASPGIKLDTVVSGGPYSGTALEIAEYIVANPYAITTGSTEEQLKEARKAAKNGDYATIVNLLKAAEDKVIKAEVEAEVKARGKARVLETEAAMNKAVEQSVECGRGDLFKARAQAVKEAAAAFPAVVQASQKAAAASPEAKTAAEAKFQAELASLAKGKAEAKAKWEALLAKAKAEADELKKATDAAVAAKDAAKNFTTAAANARAAAEAPGAPVEAAIEAARAVEEVEEAEGASSIADAKVIEVKAAIKASRAAEKAEAEKTIEAEEDMAIAKAEAEKASAIRKRAETRAASRAIKTGGASKEAAAKAVEDAELAIQLAEFKVNDARRAAERRAAERRAAKRRLKQRKPWEDSDSEDSDSDSGSEDSSSEEE
ncbi:hypothetical protein FACS1894122_10660 [Alphaproteobacteria bacterium]|nr:hypothetical protein FACS1894122_10660 [Alphaproteobacteria bacterium]